jgi:hypothetical protein
VNDASIETYKPAQLFETFKVVDDSMLDEMMKEIKAIDMESREPVTAALPNQELSFLKALRKKSVQWMNDEMEFYQKSTSSCNYLPCIREELSHPPADPSVEHLMAASDEFSRRFPFRSVEEEELNSNNRESSLSKRPFLLVANRVRDDWEAPDEFLRPIRFMLVPGDTVDSSILFIRCMSGPEHGSFRGCITRDLDKWIYSNGLESILSRIDAGGVGYEPDQTFGPLPWSGDHIEPNLDADDRLKGAPFARLVVEMELAHRDVKIVRQLGALAMNNPYTRLFLAVRVWKKNHDGNFGGAAVLWGKDEKDIISVRQAVDFGTGELNVQARRGFEVMEDDGMMPMLPPVESWTRPQPNLGHANLRLELDALDVASVGFRPQQANPNWLLVFPKADLLYKVSSSASTEALPYALSLPVTQAIDDCRIDLHWFAAIVNHITF